MADNIKGLPGLNRLSDAERQTFMLDNADKLKKYRTSKQRSEAADIIYNNQLFINTFGEDAFNELNDNTKQSYDYRNEMLKEKAAREAFSDRFSPTKQGYRDDNTGLGADYEKYYGYEDAATGQRLNGLSSDALIKILESDYKSPEEFEESWKEQVKGARQVSWNSQALGMMGPTAAMAAMNTGINVPGASNIPVEEEEAWKQHAKEQNDRILERIYNDEADIAANKLSEIVGKAYRDPAITRLSDDEVKQRFQEIITPGSYEGNLGITEFASHYGDGSAKDVKRGDMEDFTIDDMRQVLAKKMVYDRYMSPEMAATALNNDAKRYIKEHQSAVERGGLLGKDILISSLSYTMDKVNGIYNLGLMASDAMGDKPVVYVDDKGQVIDTTKTPLTKDEHGRLVYEDSEGTVHTVHQQEVAKTTLHNMGKNFDGSDNTGILNPQYWTKAEQFGTLDRFQQDQYEKLGSSPYKVMYDPNKDWDLWYEGMKMSSFVLADAAAQLIPFGIGQAGKVLATAEKLGKVGQVAGKTLSIVNGALGNSAVQGTAGALGIAYAYQRGAFQETLAKNLGDAEQAALDRSRREVYNNYNDNPQYKSQVDAAIDAKTAELKLAYVAQLGENQKIVDESAVDEMLKSQAQEAVMNEEVQKSYQDYTQNSEEYQKVQEAAINKAGQAAVTTFWPEAIKYGLVNTLGYRNWLYRNPTAIVKRGTPAIEGLREVANESGKLRLTMEPSKFLTSADKWKQLGKLAGKQFWGGAWTNGTDDMMVDAAERVAQDSYNQYLQGFRDGDAIADVYGLGDGLFSYWNGLINSLGQKETLRATTVGGVGSFISLGPNMANIAHLATKEGRDAYKHNYQQRNLYDTDANGVKVLRRDENGNPITEDIPFEENWRDRMAFFIQNGVLSTYYGAKQAEIQGQEHADYINHLLDTFDDFQGIEKVITSNIGRENAESVGDEKTMEFIQAIQTVGVLNQVANDENSASIYSTPIQGKYALMEKLAHLGEEDGQYALTEQEIQGLLSEYYSNTTTPQSEQNNQIALEIMSRNAKKLLKASDAYEKAQGVIEQIEQKRGPIDSAVKNKLILEKALDSHWEERVTQMKEEIGDKSTETEISEENLIPSIGGIANARAALKVYAEQQEDFKKSIAEQEKKNKALQEKYDKAIEELAKAQTVDDSNKKYEAEKAVKDASNELSNGQQQVVYLQDMLNASQQKESKLNKALEAASVEGAQVKNVLTADEIFALDAVSRARMLDPDNRGLYSKEQQAEIKKLEAELVNRDPEALEKIKDIGLLTQRIAANKDAYSRIAQNPEAASVELEAQRVQAADIAYRTINRRNAEDIAALVSDFDNTMKGRKDVSQEEKESFVFNLLKRYDPRLLNVIDKETLLPQYAKQVADAAGWREVVTDIDSVIDNTQESNEWKKGVKDEILSLEEDATNREEVIANLEKAIDEVENSEVAAHIEKVLSGLEALGYQRDATIVEGRKERKEREDREAKDREEARKKLDEAAQATIAEAQAAEEEAKNAQPSHEVAKDGSNIESVDEVPPIDQSPETAVQKGQLSEPLDLGDQLEAESATIDEQLYFAKDEKKEMASSEATVDYVTNNIIEQQVVEDLSASLSGNAMAEYKGDPLQSEGKLIHKEGERPEDSMSKYYAWMEAAGIKLQNIIDQELGLILARNPQANIKFMAVRPEGNATKDVDMKTHLFLVLDYDNSVNKGITDAHSEANGGVIESKGKKYLIIGTVGYGKGNTDRQALYDILFSNNPNKGIGYGLVKRGMGQFFRENPTERFFIPETLHTEAVPGSLIPGYLVKALQTDEASQYRSITEILSDAERNPQGLELDDLAWGIQELGKFLVVGTSIDNVMVPRNTGDNSGRAFVLIPAGNGKMVPSYLKPLFYNEVKEGKLKSQIEDLLVQLVAPLYATRYQAFLNLSNIFHFDKNGNTILLGKDNTGYANRISLVQNGEVFKTFVLDENFDRMDFMQAISVMNPRVNITASVLQSPVLLRQYDEAGALQTDAALLHTAGSSYSIYGIDAEGKVIKPEVLDNGAPKSSENSGFRNANKAQVVYQHQYYTYDKNNNVYYLNGVAITDEKTIESLDYNRRIVECSIEPAATEGSWRTYILGSKEAPEVIKVNKNTFEVEKFSDEEARSIMDRLEKEAADKAREENAKQTLAEQNNIQDVPLQETFVLDAESGEFVPENSQKKSQIEEKRGEEKGKVTKASTEKQEDNLYKSEAELLGRGKEVSSQTFDTLAKSKEHRKEIREIIKNKWPDAPNTPEGLTEFLRKKNIEVDSIGTSQEDVDAWIKTLTECR